MIEILILFVIIIFLSLLVALWKRIKMKEIRQREELIIRIIELSHNLQSISDEIKSLREIKKSLQSV